MENIIIKKNVLRTQKKIIFTCNQQVSISSDLFLMRGVLTRLDRGSVFQLTGF
ncbi:MAG: hypothetical protein MRERV_4c103 [Mycoplasmataceae bacterium RV_VA103A]|nr:MAG: hypothetical protein MRERV_11c058 [Mycoplasmataceae bacterium RV_VA103A]KLL05192.1 MAG: hypothetical protein MRERV_4c103 [Mycoplasmataceae bacterium RV_VA103A]